MISGIYGVIGILVEETLDQFDLTDTDELLRRFNENERPTLNKMKAAVITEVLAASGCIEDSALLN